MSENEQENEKRESVADIVAEMRERADAMQTHGTTYGVRLVVLEFARRIEAAWERDAKAIETENAVLPAVCITKGGNAAAMREALEAMNRIDTRGLKRLLCELVEADIFDGGLINKTISAVEKARRALSTPEMEMEANNAAAMREALENSNGLLEELAEIGEWGESAREQIAENNAALGFVLGIFTLPVILVAWPFVDAWWMWQETDGDEEGV